MLDAYVIEEIKRREREKSADDRPVVELPVPSPRPDRARREQQPEEDPPGGGGGVVIIDYS